jgi:hypothetical protein
MNTNHNVMAAVADLIDTTSQLEQVTGYSTYPLDENSLFYDPIERELTAQQSILAAHAEIGDALQDIGPVQVRLTNPKTGEKDPLTMTSWLGSDDEVSGNVVFEAAEYPGKILSIGGQALAQSLKNEVLTLQTSTSRQ